MTGQRDAAGAEPRVGLVVVTHGELAFELVRAFERIVGPAARRVRALSIGWDDDLQQARLWLQEAIGAADDGGGVLILTDMFGGTATNLSLSFLRPGIEIVTGVNLPMLIKFANLPAGVPLKEAAGIVKEQGQRAIALATEYVDPTRGG
ncbi:MAG TPA: PTS fructose transporter subunit IIA [Candidatus Polarisedimenticolia bacterium]|nr:PTS fructose transporter subunit IIA [Candidatus Polarisedimenticolia bacterium]